MTTTINLSNAGLKTLNDGMDKLVVSIDRLEKSISKLAKNNTSAFEKIFGTVKDFNALTKSLGTLSTVGVDGFVKISKEIRNALIALNTVTVSSTIRDYIVKLTEAIAVLQKNGRSDPGIFLKALAVGLGELAKSASGFDTKAITAIATTLTKLGSVLNNTNFSSKNVTNISTIVSQLITALSSLPAVMKALPGIGSLEIISKVFSALGQGLVALKKASDTLTNKDMTRLATIVATLSVTLKLVSAMTANIPGGTAFDQLSKTFQKLGSGLVSLSTASKSITSNSVTHLVLVFGQLIVMFKLLALALKIVPGGGALAALSTTIKNLGDGLSTLAKLGRSVRIDSALYSAVSDFIALLKPLFLSLRAFRGTTLPDFSKILTPVFAAFDMLAGKKIGKVDVKPIKEFMSALADSLNSFGKVKVDEKKLNAAASLIDAIFSKSGQFSAGRGEDIGRNFGGSITDSFLKALKIDRAVQFVFASIGTIIAQFNPAVIFQRVVDGTKALFDMSIGKLKELGASLTNIGSQLQSFGTNIFANFGLSGVANSGAFKLATDFDALSTSVQVFGNLTDTQLKSAQAFANEIGIKYPQSSNEALSAILNLQKAGLSLNQVFTALPAAADLSSLSDTKNLDAASLAIISVTSQFQNFTDTVKSSYEAASTAADIMGRVANASTASVESLVAGLNNVGPIANAAGLSLEETAAVLGLLDNAGIKGAEGGTQLKSLLTTLTSGSAESKAALKSLGVTLVDEKGNFKDINTIVNELNHALNDTKTVTVSTSKLTAAQKTQLDEAQKAYALASRQVIIYNSGLSAGALTADAASKGAAKFAQIQANAAKVILELTGSQKEADRVTTELTRTQQQNAETIKKLAGSYGQAGLNVLLSRGDDAILNFIKASHGLPTAAEQASALLNNLKGDIAQFGGSLETLMTRVMLPLIKRAFRPLVQVGRAVVDFFGSLPDSVYEVASNMILLGSTVASFVGAATIAVGFLVQFGGAMLTAAATIATLAVNIPAILGVIAGFGLGLVSLIAIAAPLAVIFTGISIAVSDFISIIENNTSGAGDALNRVKQTINDIGASVSSAFGSVGNIFKAIMGDDLGKEVEARGAKIANFFGRIYLNLLSIKKVAAQASDFLSAFSQFLSGGQESKAVQNLGDMASVFGAGTLQTAPAVLSAFDKVYKNLLDTVGGSPLVERIFGKKLGAGELVSVFGELKKSLLRVKGLVVDTLGGAGGLILNALGIGDDPAAAGRLTNGLSGLGSLVAKGLQKITGLDLSATILNFDAGNLEKGVSTFVKTIVQSLKDFVLKNEAKITDLATTLFNFFIPGTTILPRLLKALGLDAVADGVGKVFGTINKVFRAATGTLFDLFRGKSLTGSLLENFGPGVQPIITAAKALGKALSGIGKIVSTVYKALFPSGTGGKNFISIFFDGLAGVFNSVADATAILDPIIKGITTSLRSIGEIATSSPFLSRIAGVIGAVAAGLGAITIASKGALGVPDVVGAFKKLFGVLGKAIAPVLAIGAALLVIKSFFDALGESTDVISLARNTLSNFIENLAGLFGFKLDGNAILDSITTTINNLAAEVPNALRTLGDSLGAPILNQIADGLTTGNYQPVLDAISTGLRNIVTGGADLLASLGVAIGAPILVTLADAFKTGNYQPMLDEIGNGIRNIISAAPDTILKIGDIFGVPFISAIGTALKTGDWNIVLTSIGDGISALIAAGGFLVEGVGTALALPLITQLGTAMQTGDYQPVVDSIANGINIALATLGDTLKTLIVGKVGTGVFSEIIADLKQGDIGGAGDAILDILVGAVQSALKSIPGRLAELGATLNLDFLVDFGKGLDKSILLDRIIISFTNLSKLPIDLLVTAVGFISDLARSLKDLFNNVDSTGATNLKLVAIALAALFAPAIITGLGALGIAIGSLILTMAPLLYTFAGIAAVILVLKNAFTELGNFLSGDSTIGQAVGDFFIGLGEDVLGLFGVDTVFGVKIDTLSESWHQFLYLFEHYAQIAFQGVGDFFNQIVDGIVVRMALLQAQIDIASIDQNTRTRAGALFAVNDIFGKGDITNSLQALTGALTSGVDASVVAAAARLNFQPFQTAFTNNINNLAEVSDRDFAGLITGLVSSNGFDEAVAKIPPDAMLPFFKRLLEVPPDAFSVIDLGQFKTGLETALKSGQIDLNLAEAIVMRIPSHIMTDEQKLAYLAAIKADLERSNPTPVTIPVTVTPAPPGDNGFGAGFDKGFGKGLPPLVLSMTPTAAPVSTEQAQTLVDNMTQQIIAGATPPTIPVAPVALPPPTFDTGAIKDPADAALMTDNLALLQAQVVITTPSLDALALSSLTLNTNLNTLVNGALAGILLGIDKLKIAATFAAIDVPIKMGILAIGFGIAANAAALSLDPLLEKIKKVKDEINAAAAALGSLNGGGTPGKGGNGGGGGVPVDGHLAGGGDVFAGSLYEVAEKGISELLRIGGKTYLIPGQNGTVIPPSASAAPPPQAARAGNSSVTNSSFTDSSTASVVVNIQGGTSLTEEQISRATQKGIADEKRRNPLNRRLVLGGVT